MHNNKNKLLRHLTALITLLTVLAGPPQLSAAPLARDFLANDFNAANQIIVRLRPHTLSTQSFRLRVNGLAGIPLTFQRFMGNGAHIYQLPAHMPVTYVRQIAARIAQDPNVLYAEPNLRRRRISPLLSMTAAPVHRTAFTGMPDDPLLPQQWALYGTAASMNAPEAWRMTTGSSRVVIGIVDSGARFDHEDLRGRLIAGVDDTNGSMQPIDTGGNIGGGEFIYHGTYIAGVIGAATNNGLGTAGINWISKMLIVRDGDDFGDTDATASDGIRWAAGIPVPGLPNNPNPARVINYSSGGQGTCSQTDRDMISEIRAKGVVLVVAAGNDGIDVRNDEPANCPGVISAAAIDSSGNRASFSNYGPIITIAAPGQQIIMPGGTTYPPKSNAYTTQDGTSFAAPMVTCVVSLMLSVNPSLTPDAVARLLKQSARPFPPGANCNGVCQAGILDAGRAVALAAGQSNAPSTPTQTLRVLISATQTVPPGARVNLAGIGLTAPGAQIASYLWRQVGGPPVQLSNPHVARPFFTAPRMPADLLFQLTVTNSLQRTASAAMQVRVVNR